MSSFVEGLVAGYGIAIPVGAIAVLIVNTGMRCGFRVALAAGAGAATADLLYALVAAAAGAAVAAALEPIAPGLRVLSGVVLIALAVLGLRRGLRPPEDSIEAAACDPLHTYARFLGLTIINPLTVVYFGALILGRDARNARGLVDQAAFVAGAGLSSLSWQTLVAGVGGIARRHLTDRVRVSAVVLGNLVVLALGLRILLKALP